MTLDSSSPALRLMRRARGGAIALCGSLALAGSAVAAELNVTVQIPRLNVAEYHRPYVAVWIEREDQSIASHLAVWYLIDNKNEDGTQWLKDLRQWWRRGGRELTVPVDGVTGATRPVGTHKLTFKSDSKQLASLAPGKYNLVIEAVREVGGRELLRMPLEWPATKPQTGQAQGTSELGAVAFELNP
jgi:hypothetical protein